MYIPKKDLVVGGVYKCKARNFIYGIWDGKAFLYLRYKLGDRFPDYEDHWDDGGTAKPLLKIDGVEYQLLAVLEEVLEWYGLDGDGISDPLRGKLLVLQETLKDAGVVGGRLFDS